MREFFDLTVTFPPIIFTFGMVLMLMYWLTVILGLFDLDIMDIDADSSDGGDSDGGFWQAFGFGSAPATIILSVWIAIGWITTMLVTIWIDTFELAAGIQTAVGIATLLAALAIGIGIGKLLSKPLSNFFEDSPVTSNSDLVGKTCIVQTGSVTTEFGQAEVTDDDGATHTVDVRRSNHEPDSVSDTAFTRGSTLVIFDYDEANNVFLVVAVENTATEPPSA